MTAQFNKLIVESIPNQDKANALVDKLITVAHPHTIFSQPITEGANTVITASEISIALGTMYGGGGGLGVPSTNDQGQTTDSGSGFGGGGGGGGTALGRPVAAIIINEQGVRIEPIVDPTKIAVAFLTTLGTLMVTLLKARRAAK